MEFVVYVVLLFKKIQYIFFCFLRYLLGLLIIFYWDEQEFNYILEEINCKIMIYWVIKIQNIINNDVLKKKKMIDCQLYLDFIFGIIYVFLILYDCM